MSESHPAGDAAPGEHLEGRVALVTGAAGGLGGALVRALAARRAVVVACDVDEERLRAASSGIEGEVRPLRMDLSDPADVLRGVADVEREHGGVDVLVNAAVRHFGGDDGRELRTFADHSPEQVLETLAVAVTGPTVLAQRLCRGMIERRWGRIVLVGSMHRSGTAGLVMYAASKAYVNALARGLFLELREHDVLASVANPGGMNTRLHDFHYPWMLDPAVVAEAIVRNLELPATVALLSFEIVPHDPEHPDSF